MEKEVDEITFLEQLVDALYLAGLKDAVLFVERVNSVNLM